MVERVIERTMNQSRPVFITQNPVMKDLLTKIKLVAKTKASLLITGENGTGKEVLAGLAHYYSSRSDNEMITINCGAIPEDLVVSELFGYEKGAFTGATERKEGYFAQGYVGTCCAVELERVTSHSVYEKLYGAVDQNMLKN